LTPKAARAFRLTMIRKFVIAGVVASTLAGGCDGQMEWQRKRTAGAILSATDLATVPGAHGRMTARELVSERPSLAFIPYAGYGETLGSDSVIYRFNARDISSTAVDSNARPDRVSLTRTFASEREALAYWRSSVQRILRDHSEPTSCWSVPGPTGGQVARWANPSIHLEIAVRRPIDVGPEVVPDRVVISADRDAPLHFPGSQVPCSEIIEVR
jgi:hypothetical protein